MRKFIFALFIILITTSSSFAQYGLKDGKIIDPLIVPPDTTRIQANSYGATLYNRNGYSGRIYNTPSGREVFSRNGGYAGRTYSTGNGGLRFVPSPTYHYNRVPAYGGVNHR